MGYMRVSIDRDSPRGRRRPEVVQDAGWNKSLAHLTAWVVVAR